MPLSFKVFCIDVPPSANSSPVKTKAIRFLEESPRTIAPKYFVWPPMSEASTFLASIQPPWPQVNILMRQFHPL